MLEGIKNFINEANKIIKKETRKINLLHKEIGEYETLIYVIEKTDVCLENINSSKDRIATMRMVDNIIKRGEKSA